MIRPSRPSRPVALACGVLFIAVALLVVSFHDPLKQRALSSFTSKHDHNSNDDGTTTTNREDRLHILLPASEGNVDLCKTLLTGSMLGYPTPTLIAWNATFENNGGLLGGGSHVAKISGVLDYLESMEESEEDDIVMMMDAYDIWFQLRPEVLISRYHAINAAANKRLVSRLGNAVKAEKLQQTIIFGAGKRCAPNQMHTIACYPIPESPLPDDVYGANTDTIMGKNKYTSLKQRYLNSGYIIGPAGDLRRMFNRAWELVQSTTDHDEYDNGSGGSDFMYHGSDQSIFNIMLGEQEFQREVMRRRHSGWIDWMRGRSKPKPTYLEGTLIKDPLNPSFTHQPMEHMDGREYEFSMGLDYFSELGHQTVNTEEDTRYLRFNESIDEQLQTRHGLFDCKSRVTGHLPHDILSSLDPLDGVRSSLQWEGASLFTNLCLDTIPVMIHHNGDKGARAWQWESTWMQPHAREVLANILGRSPDSVMSTIEPSDTSAGGAFLPGGARLGWDDLCPAAYEWELFRDVDKPEER